MNVTWSVPSSKMILPGNRSLWANTIGLLVLLSLVYSIAYSACSWSFGGNRSSRLWKQIINHLTKFHENCLHEQKIKLTSAVFHYWRMHSVPTIGIGIFWSSKMAPLPIGPLFARPDAIRPFVWLFAAKHAHHRCSPSLPVHQDYIRMQCHFWMLHRARCRNHRSIVKLYFWSPHLDQLIHRCYCRKFVRGMYFLLYYCFRQICWNPHSVACRCSRTIDLCSHRWISGRRMEINDWNLEGKLLVYCNTAC